MVGVCINNYIKESNKKDIENINPVKIQETILDAICAFVDVEANVLTNAQYEVLFNTFNDYELRQNLNKAIDLLKMIAHDTNILLESGKLNEEDTVTFEKIQKAVGEYSMADR